MSSFAHTTSAASRVQPPANTARRVSSFRSGPLSKSVAPVECAAQSALSIRRGSAATCEQHEAIVQATGDLLNTQDRHPRRRKLDGQRNAFETMADLRDGRRVARRGPPAARRVSPRPSCPCSHQGASCRLSPATGPGPARTSPRRYSAIRGSSPGLARPGTSHKGIDEFGARPDQVLTTVEHEKQRPSTQNSQDCLQQ